MYCCIKKKLVWQLLEMFSPKIKISAKTGSVFSKNAQFKFYELLRRAFLYLKPRDNSGTGQKIKFSFKDFFGKCDQNRRSHLLKKSLMEKCIFGAVWFNSFVNSNSTSYKGLIGCWKLCLNLCFHQWHKPRHRLVIHFIPLTSWPFYTELRND